MKRFLILTLAVFAILGPQAVQAADSERDLLKATRGRPGEEVIQTGKADSMNRMNAIERRLSQLEEEINYLEERTRNLDRRVDDLRQRR